MRKAALHNLGCKVNAYETEAMQQLLEDAGYEIVPFKDGADVYIINTCSVTNVADKKSRQMLHRAKKMNPDSVVVAVGCYVQAAKEDLEKDMAVDLIIGNNKKKDLVGLLERYFADRDDREEVIDIAATGEYEELHIRKIADHTRAFIKVQDGCNQFCSYCIIPYARGRVRSRKPEDVEAEVKGLVARGYREVVLTGIHLSSYGTEHMEGSPVKGGDWDSGPLWDLIERIHRVEGLERIRLGSLEPRIITREFAEKLAGLPEFCPHFHLSLQSGCDATLKRMNRHYTTEDYLRRCGILREIFDHPAITTDVIAGFPGETEEEFEETRRFLETVRFYEMHVFKYSKRQGTRAAVMEDQVSEQVKARRSDVLLELEKTMSREYRERFAGSRVSVLFEEAAEIGGKWYMMGHTPQYVRAALPLEDGMNREEFGGRIMELFASGLLNDEMLKVEFS